MSVIIKRNDLEEVKKVSREAYEFITDKQKCCPETPDGRVELGNGCYAMVSSYETASRDAKEFESHRKYADVQMLIEGSEYIEAARIDSLEITKDYSDEKDVMFFSNRFSGDDILLEPMVPVLLLPETGHMPGVMSGDAPERVKKVVVKIPIELFG